MTGPAGAGAESGSIPALDVPSLLRRVNLLSLVGGPSTPDERDRRLVHRPCPHCRGIGTAVVSVTKYVCLACGQEGGALDWIRADKRLSYTDAVEAIAQMERGPEAAAELRQRHDRAVIAINACAQWFHEQFAASDEARAYWRSRGFDEALATDLRVGFAPAEVARFFSFATEHRISRQALLDAGLLRQVRDPAKGLALRTVFRHRLLFPIESPDGRTTVAFGGRRLIDDASAAGYDPRKYLNSANSLLWTKAESLWGLADARDAIAAEHAAILVEGYFARARLLSLGIKHVVAPCGTSLTRGQAELLVQAIANGSHANRKRVVVVLYDDGAREQAYRAARTLLAAGADVRLPLLPAGSDDPDTWVRTVGPEPLRALLAAPPSVAEARVADAHATHGPSLPLLEFVDTVETLMEDVTQMGSGSVQSAAATLLGSEFSVTLAEVKDCVKQLRGRIDPKRAR